MKETPAEATNSHQLLVRGGYVRQIGAGIDDYLPLGLRVLKKIETIVRAEMDRAGASEVLMPALLPAEYFQETGRWGCLRTGALAHQGPQGRRLPPRPDARGDHHRHGSARGEELPPAPAEPLPNPDEVPRRAPPARRPHARPRVRHEGRLLVRRRRGGAVKSYETMREAYKRIFTRLGLTFRIVQADSGAIGGKTSAEFQILADSGEDAIVACDNCDYAANVEAAVVAPSWLRRRPAPPPPRRCTPPAGARSSTSPSS